MKTLMFVFSSLILFSCSTQKKESTSKIAEATNASFLQEGEHYIKIDNVKLWYLVRGEGPVLIVYPSSAGWGGDASVYFKYLKPWEKHRTVIYIEPRGLGKSERLNSLSDYTMEKYVEELELFRRKLKIKDFDLAGHCYAGMIAQKYAIKYGDFLKRLILISTTPTLKYPGYQEWEKNRIGYTNMVMRYGEIENSILTGTEKLKEQMKNWYTITFQNYDKHKIDFERTIDSTVFSELPLKQFQQFDQNRFNVEDSLVQITAQTLILYGDNDFPPMVKGSEVLADKIDNSKLIVFNNCSHWCFIEYPDVFFSETIDFLNN